MGFTITDQCRRANMLPTWRTLHLNHMKQLRMMIRDRRQVDEARTCLKGAQRSAALARRTWFASADNPSMSFDDGRTFHLGDLVEVCTKYGTDGVGTVIGFNFRAGKVKIALDPSRTIYGPLDRWQVRENGEPMGFYDRARDQGLAGGEIERILKQEIAA